MKTAGFLRPVVIVLVAAGFGHVGTYVSYSTGGSFTPASYVIGE